MPSGWLELNDSVNLSPQNNSGGNANPIGALSGSSPNAIIQAPGAGGVGSLQVGLLNKDSTFAGSIQRNNSLVKVGIAGKMTLYQETTPTPTQRSSEQIPRRYLASQVARWSSEAAEI